MSFPQKRLEHMLLRLNSMAVEGMFMLQNILGRVLASALAALFFQVAHAADLKIDGTSKETFERSVKAMADTLSNDDKEIFGSGLMNLILTEYPPARGLDGFAVLAIGSQAVDAAHITLNGKTMAEIMERGRSLAQKKEAADTEKKGLGEKARDDETRRECLKQKVVLTNARIVKASFGHNIEIDVTNNLKWAISGIRLAYTATSEGRAVPWIETKFALSISGGIEPGETRKIASSASPPAAAPSALIVKALLQDVADQDKRLFVRDVRVSDWGEERSFRRCE